MTATRSVGRPALDAADIARIRAGVIAAAASCFAEQGTSATSIDDIGRRAGVSRATVYRYVGGRDELIVGVALQRFEEWVEGVVRHVDRFDTAGDIITEAVVWTERAVRHDRTLAGLFAGGTAVAASRVLSQRGDASPVASWRRRFSQVLEPVATELRPGLAPELVADRVLAVVLDRLARDDTTEHALRDWITAWLLPAILEQRPPLPDSGRRVTS